MARAYGQAAAKRDPWTEVEAGLEEFGFRDTAAGRRGFVERLEKRARLEKEDAGETEMGGQTLNSTLRRGWYWGNQAFREKLLGKIQGRGRSNRNYQTGRQGQDHSLHQAEQWLERGLRFFKKEAHALRNSRGSERTKVAIAGAIARKTTVSQKWISEKLSMGSPANVSQQIRRFPSRAPHPKGGNQWIKSVKNC